MEEKRSRLPLPIFLSPIFLSKRKPLESTATPGLIVCLAAFLTSAGCNRSADRATDPQPFKTAIAEYLERGNMAMALKEIKEGPTVSGNTATMKASLVHAQMPGPAVTWVFRFEKGPDGKWKVVKHES